MGVSQCKLSSGAASVSFLTLTLPTHVQGVRFNAEKQQVGNYFSTKIWNFSMKSPCCGERIEVQTDPKNHEYVVVRGARRKVRFCFCWPFFVALSSVCLAGLAAYPHHSPQYMLLWVHSTEC